MKKGKIIFTACSAAAGLIFLVLSVVFEKRVEPPSTINEAKFCDYSDNPNESPFLQTLIKEINNSKSEIHIVAKNFVFPSDYPDIQNAFEAANKRNVKIHILSSNTGVPSYAEHHHFNNSIFKNGLNSDFILFDKSTILIPALPLFSTRNQLGVIYQNAPSLVDDVMRFILLGTKVCKTGSNVGTDLWPSSLLVTRNIKHPHVIKNMGNISFAQTPGIIPPVRDESVAALGSALNSAKNSVMISTSRFIQRLGKSTEFTIVDGISAAANKGAKVKLLISGNKNYLNPSLQWASTVASSENVEVRIRDDLDAVPNFLIADSTFVVGSASFSDIAYSSSFGLRMVVSGLDNVRNDLVSAFERDWNMSKPFSDYIDLIWTNTTSTK